MTPSFSRVTLCLAFLSIGIASHPAEGVPQREKPSEVLLRNESLLIHLQAKGPGIRVIALENLLTNLRVTPDQGLAPFILKDAAGHSFSALQDFLPTRVTSTRRSAMIEFRGQGILLSGRLEISLGRNTSFWELHLHNSSASDWRGEIYFPVIACSRNICEESILWWGQGCGRKALWSSRPSTEIEYGQDLSVPAFLLSTKGGGFFCTDNGRWDLLKVPSLARSRSLYAGPMPGVLAEGDTLQTVGWKQQLVIPSGEDRVIGPVVLGVYRGNPEEGFTELTPIRRRLVRTLPPGSLSKVGVLYRDPSSIPQGAMVILSNALTWTPEGRLVGSPFREGNTGLRRYLRLLHEAGNQVLLELPVLSLPSGSLFALGETAKEWQIKPWRGEEEHEASFLPLCPAVEGWRKLLAREMVRVMQVTGADGFLLRWQQAFRKVCYHPTHQHPSPFIGSWGLRQLFRDLNSYFSQEQVKPIILAEGPSDLIADFVEGFVVSANAFLSSASEEFSPPAGLLFRSLYPQKRLYIEIPAGKDDIYPVSASLLASLALSLGMGLFLPSGPQEVSIPLRYQEFLRNYPEYLASSPFFGGVAQAPKGGQAQVWQGSRLWLSLFNPSKDPLQGGIRFSFPVASLKDPLTGLVLEPNPQGDFIIGVMGEQTVLWEIETSPPT